MKNFFPLSLMSVFAFSSCTLSCYLLFAGIFLVSPRVAIATPIFPQATLSAQAQLPTAILEAVRQDLARRTGLNSDRLKVKQASLQTWPDGCLGLAKPKEFCTQALIEGWRVVLTDGQKIWVYRTDGTGRTIRRES